jgi:hypothetical protein
MFNGGLLTREHLKSMPRKYRFYIRPTLQVAIFVILVSLSVIVRAEEAKSVLSIGELKDLAEIIESVEKSLLNLKVESEIWMETKESLSDPCEPWKRTPVYVSSTAWFDGRPRGKAKVDVHKQVLEWQDGAAPYAESSYSVSFDGTHGRVVNHTIGHSGKTYPRKEGRILSHAPKRLTTGWADLFTGLRFSLNFFFNGKDYTFSDLFRWAEDPNTLVLSSFQFTQEMFQGVKCIKIASKESNQYKKSQWLDLERDFALLGDKHTSILEDGTERLVSFSNVSKLKEVAPGIWWPMEASMVSRPFDPGKPWRRYVYVASNVVANDPNFKESVFNAPFPEGYLIDDKVTGRKYTVGQQ